MHGQYLILLEVGKLDILSEKRVLAIAAIHHVQSEPKNKS